MGASYSTKLILAFRSGDKCAFPGCPCVLTLDDDSGDKTVVVGEAAHIKGEKQKDVKKTSARYDPNMTDEDRNHISNLIYLCRNHHKQIDDFPDDFPVERLLALKAEHEAKVREAINQAFKEVGFEELAQATAWISRIKPESPTSDLNIVALDEKIKLNGLSNLSKVTILMGLSVVGDVKSFVEHEASIDDEFPERLKAGFLQEYFKLRKEGHRNDDLFDLMCQFSQQGMKDQSKKSASLAVLVYLFELCEVFEK